VAVTEQVVPAFPVAVSVVPETVQLPVVEYVVAPAVPPVDVSVKVEPYVIEDDDVIVTVA
jgi:hypothetical protein